MSKKAWIAGVQIIAPSSLAFIGRKGRVRKWIKGCMMAIETGSSGVFWKREWSSLSRTMCWSFCFLFHSTAGYK